MCNWIKKPMYFIGAFYFAFFAKIMLYRWNPRIIVITGSSGKTTLLNLIESTLGKTAVYSHNANSAYGIPFDILQMKRISLQFREWIYLILLAPFSIMKKPWKQKIYIVEADCDRPFEGKFLSIFLKPEVTLWLNSTRTHSVNFDSLVKKGLYKSVEYAIAYEFGYFIQHTKKLIIINNDSQLIRDQLSRTKVKFLSVSKKSLKKYHVDKNGTEFQIDSNFYTFKNLLVQDVFYSIAMVQKLLEYLQIEFKNTSFTHFSLAPGRSSIFKGVNNITIIDSSYNANLDSMENILKMYNVFKADHKWAVLSDMLEQGEKEKGEHEELAKVIAKINLEKIILMGPRVIKYTYPIILKLIKDDKKIVLFENPKEVLDYIQNNSKGGETILFKGARFLEGVIENLLLDKRDAEKLCRREKVWQIRRKRWKL